MKEIAEKSSEQCISFALVDAWYATIYGNYTEKDLQPLFSDITRTPTLLHVFEGYLLKRIEFADYGEDISSFITSKFKMLLQGYLEALKVKGAHHTEAQKVLIGASSGVSVYPPMTDYSTDRLDSINHFVYFLAALELCVQSLNIQDNNPSDKDMIRQGKLFELIEKNAESVKDRYQNERQFKEAYVYVVDNFERYMNRFSAYMFSHDEQELLAFIFRSKGFAPDKEQVPLNSSQTEPPLRTRDEDDFELNPMHALDSHAEPTEIIPKKESSETRSLFSRFKALFEAIGETDKPADPNHASAKKYESEKTVKKKKEQEDDDSYDALIISAKKKNSSLPLILITVSVVLVGVFLVAKGGEEETSIIDKSQSEMEQPSEFRTIIER
ncbi:hypothetical protein [Photobacterium galatheae]|uniref:Uncharacterized protein n=1 Tax=Photobacterium galatheae TaxID=1654360 RepID=A0A066RKP5_9GAMM|nr:hypothetical protein [Photobacterium galatheae]KDM90919.1 hypothetical protein EA58_14260 [Photobacterium galatheae]MCM0149117.1 hypothetical protein [Photobacterium galatheae]